MRVLVLGGTVFLGRHVVEAAVAAGHRVTMFTRGLTQPHLHPGVERIRGDRDGGLGGLVDRHWDAILDTCGFVPRIVAQSARLSARRYLFVSSISVYADLTVPPTSTSPTHPPPDHEDVPLAYGGLKAGCEQVVRDLATEAVILRPGLIGGPHDPTGRFTYWPVRVAEGGDVLAPGPRDAPVQFIDVRDLALWMVRLAESGPAGTFNAVGPRRGMEAFLGEIRTATHSEARWVWATEAQLAGITPWSELPLWAPGSDGTLRIDPAPAMAAGLQCRPVVDSARDTLAWARTLTGDPPRQVDGRYVVQTLTREEERVRIQRIVAG